MEANDVVVVAVYFAFLTELPIPRGEIFLCIFNFANRAIFRHLETFAHSEPEIDHPSQRGVIRNGEEELIFQIEDLFSFGCILSSSGMCGQTQAAKNSIDEKTFIACALCKKKGQLVEFAKRDRLLCFLVNFIRSPKTSMRILAGRGFNATLRLRSSSCWAEGDSFGVVFI